MTEEYRFIGYLPTVQLTQVLSYPYFANQAGLVWELHARTSRTIENRIEQPLSYFDVETRCRKESHLDFVRGRHGSLEPPQLLSAMLSSGIDEMNVEKIAVGIDRKMLSEKALVPINGVQSGSEPDSLLLATFASNLVGKGGDKEAVDVIKNLNEEFIQNNRGKYSCLDLMKIEDWGCKKYGVGQEYALTKMAVRMIIWEIYGDYAGLLRTYKRSYGDVWTLIGNERITRETLVV